VTNAAKYGALSSPEGRVSVQWEPPTDGATPTLTIAWRETGGPPVRAAASQEGYGTSLIRDLIPHELGGTVDLVLAPEGVRCTIVIPLDRASAGQPQA
jgi:two-component sensor histidine kinase